MAKENLDREEEKVQEHGLFEEYEEMLEDHERKERRRRLVGPAISAGVHLVAAVVAALLIVPQFEEEDDDIEISTKPSDYKEIEPKSREKLKKQKELKNKAKKAAPEIYKTEISKESPEEPPERSISEDSKPQSDTTVTIDPAPDINFNNNDENVPGFGTREDGEREKAVKKRGGSKKETEAVLDALRWLKRTQKSDGSWGEYEGRECKRPVAFSSFALLAFLAHGETPGESEEFGATVRKAIHYLKEHMMNKDKVDSRPHAYINGIETYALAEAYGMTKLPFLKAPARKGLKMILEGQQKNGAWNYAYDAGANADEGGSRWDLSVTGWQIQALKAGYAAGIKIPGMGQAIHDAVRFVKDVAYKNGNFGYKSPGRGGWAMQSAGILALQLLGERNSREVRVALEKVENEMPFRWDESSETREDEKKIMPGDWPVYSWYYLTQAMFHGGEDSWDKWNRKYPEKIVEWQESDGHWEMPKDQRDFLGPWYTTSLLALTLQVYYRYLPTYEIPDDIAINPQEESSGLDLDSSDTEGLRIKKQ